MGCALKTIKKKVRFTDKQKQFLTEEFNNGEETGRKSDPQEVSKAMALVKTGKVCAGLSPMRF